MESNGFALFVGSIFVFIELSHYINSKLTLKKVRDKLSKKLSSSTIDYTDAKEYFEKCHDAESKLILKNITTKTTINKHALFKSFSHYCNPLGDQIYEILDILHYHHDLDDSPHHDDIATLESRCAIIKFPNILNGCIHLVNYYITYKLKNRDVHPIDSNQNVYIRYNPNNTKTIIVFSGIVGGRMVLLRMLKYIPENYNIIATVYEEISYKCYEDIIYDVLQSYNIKSNVVVYSWSYGTIFANKFLTKYSDEFDIKLKVFCDIFGLPLNTLYLAQICATENYIEAYKLVEAKVKPFGNRLLMLFLLKSEIIEKRIMTLKLNDYLIWSYKNLNSENTLMFISNDDIMYDTNNVKNHCDLATIYVFNGGHCAGVNRKSLTILKNKLNLL